MPVDSQGLEVGRVKVLEFWLVTRESVEDALVEIDGIMSVVFFVTMLGWDVELVDRMINVDLTQDKSLQKGVVLERVTFQGVVI